MPHPKRLPVRELFRLLHQLGIAQRDVAAYLGLTKQAVGNWATGYMSLPARYRKPFLQFVGDAIGKALRDAKAQPLSSNTSLLAMPPCDNKRYEIENALRRWRDECFIAHGGMDDAWLTAFARLAPYGKETMTDLPEDGRAEAYKQVQQLGRLLRARAKLDAEPSAHERFESPMLSSDPQRMLWDIFSLVTGQQEGEESAEG